MFGYLPIYPFIDQKEAITPMIFASCRCLDMAKLVDAAKQFTTLYGKEFLSTTIVMLHEKCLSLFTFYLCFYSYTLKYYFRYVTKFNMNYCCSNLHLSQFFQSMCVVFLTILRYAYVYILDNFKLLCRFCSIVYFILYSFDLVKILVLFL